MTAILAAALSGAAVYAALGGFAEFGARRRLTTGVAAPAAPPGVRRWRSTWSTVAGWSQHTRSRAEAARRAAVMELCRAIVAELRAGSPPAEALVRSAHHTDSLLPGGVAPRPVAPYAVAAARSGLDLVAALHADASEPGAAGLRGLAACVQVAGDTGAGLAPAVARVVSTLRAEQEQRDRIAAELAGPRATARLLAVLPLLGLGLGLAIGADPLHVMLGTSWGQVVAVAGIAFDVAGFLWVRALAGRAERIP